MENAVRGFHDPIVLLWFLFLEFTLAIRAVVVLL